MRKRRIEIRVNDEEYSNISDFPDIFSNLSEYIRDTLLNPSSPSQSNKKDMDRFERKIDLLIDQVGLLSSQLQLQHKSENKSYSKPKVLKSLIAYWLSHQEQLVKILDLDELQQFIQFDFQKSIVYPALDQLETEGKVYVTKTNKLRWKL